jgi:uncharacterized protein
MTSQDRASYVAGIETWRKKREEGLRAPDSWLSLTGLFMLSDGVHTVGSGPDNTVILPPSAPAALGLIQFANGVATLDVTCAEAVKVDGAITQHAVLKDNSAGAPSLATVGSTIFFIHAFSGMHAVRVKDTQNPRRLNFRGCLWFDINPALRVVAQFERNAQPVVLPITTVRDTSDEYPSAGRLTFTLQGQALSLQAMATSKPGQLWAVMRDKTTGDSTYRAARFLPITVLEDGTADLDFNKAYNPPCAFSDFATCPMPPAENILPVAITAGERTPA